MNSAAGLIWLVVLLLGNAFFVSAEFSIVGARRSQIEPRAEAGSRAAKTTLYAMEHVSLMLAVCQLGITVCSLLIGDVAEPALHHLLLGPLEFLGLPAGTSTVIAFVLAMTVVVYLHVVVGEMIPKNLALAASGRAALFLAPPLVYLGKVVKFVTGPLNAAANGVLRLVGITPRGEVNSTFTVEEVQSIVSESMREGKLTDATGVLAGALGFSELTAADVMVERSALVTLPDTCTPTDVERLVGKNGFSRFLLTDDDGDLVGYVHIKDVLYADERPELMDRPIASKRFRSLVSVAHDDDLEDAMATMQRSGIHVARVIDPDGTTSGVIFLEDVIEELVGEIRDAMQEEERKRV